MSEIFSTRRYSRWRLCRLRKAGRIVRCHPGVYVLAGLERQPGIRLRAAAEHRPDGVFVGRTAAAISFGRLEELPSQLQMASNRSWSRPGLTEQRRHIPERFIREHQGLRFTTPAYTAVELAATDDGAAIDEYLRRGGSLDALLEVIAYFSNSRGNAERRRVVEDSRSHPWSFAERLLHRLLRRGKIAGWRANIATECAGRRFYLDAAIVHLGLALEVDGRGSHSSRTAFENDRHRQNLLQTHGWLVLRFTYRMLVDFPADVLATIRRAVNQRSRARSPARASPRG